MALQGDKSHLLILVEEKAKGLAHFFSRPCSCLKRLGRPCPTYCPRGRCYRRDCEYCFGWKDIDQKMDDAEDWWKEICANLVDRDSDPVYTLRETARIVDVSIHGARHQWRMAHLRIGSKMSCQRCWEPLDPSTPYYCGCCRGPTVGSPTVTTEFLSKVVPAGDRERGRDMWHHKGTDLQTLVSPRRRTDNAYDFWDSALNFATFIPRVKQWRLTTYATRNAIYTMIVTYKDGKSFWSVHKRYERVHHSAAWWRVARLLFIAHGDENCNDSFASLPVELVWTIADLLWCRSDDESPI